MLSKLRDGLGNQVLLLVVAYYTRGVLQSIRDLRNAGLTAAQLAPVLRRARRLEMIADALRKNRWRHIKPAGL